MRVLCYSPIRTEVILISQSYDTTLDPPFAYLLPAVGGNKAVDWVALTPDIVLLDVRLLALSVGDPGVRLRGDGFGAKCGEEGCQLLKNAGR